MSYIDLAEKLQKISRVLLQHGPKLEGVALQKAATTLAKSLTTFEKKLDAAVKGNDPSLEALQNLLKTHPAARLLKAPSWEKLLKEVFSHHAKAGAKPAELKKQYIEHAKQTGQGEDAFHAVQREMQQLSIPPAPVPKEKILLQKEFLRLGGLSDEDAYVELEKRWKKIGDLKALATANAILVPKSFKAVQRPQLIKEILHYARRAHLNVSRS
jgi:hypothetical protein